MAEANCSHMFCRACRQAKPKDDFPGRPGICLCCKRLVDAAYAATHKEQRAKADRERNARRRDARREAEGWIPYAERVRRVCSSCGADKSIDEFPIDRKTPNGRGHRCSECARLHSKKWYRSNKGQAAKVTSAWRAKNPERVKQYAATAWRKTKSNPCARLRYAMRTAVGRSVKNGIEAKAYKLIGYSLAELRQHLERQFTKGMCWENYGKWHIDHIVPLSSFEFVSTDCPGFKRAWALPNLRPLWASDNVRKSNKRTHLL